MLILKSWELKLGVLGVLIAHVDLVLASCQELELLVELKSEQLAIHLSLVDYQVVLQLLILDFSPNVHIFVVHEPMENLHGCVGHHIVESEHLALSINVLLVLIFPRGLDSVVVWVCVEVEERVAAHESLHLLLVDYNDFV